MGWGPDPYGIDGIGRPDSYGMSAVLGSTGVVGGPDPYGSAFEMSDSGGWGPVPYGGIAASSSWWPVTKGRGLRCDVLCFGCKVLVVCVVVLIGNGLADE